MPSSLANRELPRYPLASVDHVLRLLRLLGDGKPLRISDVAETLNVAPSTAHRLFGMLQHHGFSQQRPGSKAYTAGPSLAALARDVLEKADLETAAQPILDALARASQETIMLAVLEGRHVRFVAGRESARVLRVGALIGQAHPAHATAAGRVLLAELTPAQIRAHYPSDRLPATVGRPALRRTTLERELVRVRGDGYAITIDTNAPGVSAIAVPVRFSDGRAHGALTLVAPTTRFDPAVFASTLPALLRAAARIARDTIDV